MAQRSAITLSRNWVLKNMEDGTKQGNVAQLYYRAIGFENTEDIEGGR